MHRANVNKIKENLANVRKGRGRLSISKLRHNRERIEIKGQSAGHIILIIRSYRRCHCLKPVWNDLLLFCIPAPRFVIIGPRALIIKQLIIRVSRSRCFRRCVSCPECVSSRIEGTGPRKTARCCASMKSIWIRNTERGGARSKFRSRAQRTRASGIFFRDSDLHIDHSCNKSARRFVRRFRIFTPYRPGERLQ